MQASVADVNMCLGADMDVRRPSMTMSMDRPDLTLAPRLDQRAHAERDQDAGDCKLERHCESRWQDLTERDQDGADDEQRNRMTEAPERAQHGTTARVVSLGRERRDRGQVIGLERMAQADQEAEQHTCNRGRHGGRTLPPRLSAGEATERATERATDPLTGH